MSNLKHLLVASHHHSPSRHPVPSRQNHNVPCHQTSARATPRNRSPPHRLASVIVRPRYRTTPDGNTLGRLTLNRPDTLSVRATLLLAASNAHRLLPGRVVTIHRRLRPHQRLAKGATELAVPPALSSRAPANAPPAPQTSGPHATNTSPPPLPPTASMPPPSPILSSWTPAQSSFPLSLYIWMPTELAPKICDIDVFQKHFPSPL